MRGYGPQCETNGLRRPYLTFYVFTGILFSERPPGAVSYFLRFYRPLYFSDGLRRPYLSLREERYGRKTRQRAPKPPFGFWLFYTGVRRGDVRKSYEFALVQLTRFRPVSSSQAPHPSFCLSGQKLSRSAAPPLPTKPTYVGLWRGPYWRPP